jgi:hypothetical protein
MSIFAEDYKDEIKKTFLGNPIIPLWTSNGLKKKNYELRMGGCSFTFDLFLNYKLDDNKHCNYYHATKKVYT